MRAFARGAAPLLAIVLLSLAVTGVLAWWVSVAVLYGAAAASALAGALLRPDDPTARRLSSARVRWQQAVLRALGWGSVMAAVLAPESLWALALVPVVVLERGYAGARNSDVLLYDDRLVTESESLLPEVLPASEIVGVEAESPAWSESRRLVVVSNPARRTPLLPCRAGTDNATRVLAWAREHGIAVPSDEDG